MLKALCATSLSLAVIGSPAVVLAVPIESVPNPRRTAGGWVSDTAHLLSPQSQADLNRIISELEAKNGSEVAVVTVRDTAPSASPKAFATKLFNTWGIGKRDKNNGVLLLVSRNDRRVEIETGQGLGERLSDERVRQIIQQEMIPQFQREQFDAGTVAGTRAIVQTLKQESDPWHWLFDKMAFVVFICLMWGGFYRLLCLLPHSKRGFRQQTGHSASTSSSSDHNRSSYTSSSNSSSDSSSSSSSDFGGGSSSGGGGGDSW